MKVDMEKAVNEWTTEENLYSGTYGKLYGTVNPSIKMATLRWSGNSSTPNGDVITVSDLDAKYTPKGAEYMTVLRNGDAIKVTNGSAEIRLRNSAWSVGIITYPTA